MLVPVFNQALNTGSGSYSFLVITPAIKAGVYIVHSDYPPLPLRFIFLRRLIKLRQGGMESQLSSDLTASMLAAVPGVYKWFPMKDLYDTWPKTRQRFEYRKTPPRKYLELITRKIP